MGIGVEGDFDRVTLREMAENDLVPRLERVEGVAAVTVNGGLRRQIHIELSKEKITALDLSVDRVISTIRTENQNVPLGEVDEGDTTYLLRSQGQFQNLDQIRDLVVHDEGRRAGLPARHRRGQGHDRRPALVPRASTASPASGCRSRSSRARTRSRSPTASAREIERINREMPSVHLTLLDDQSKFIERSIDAVKEARLPRRVPRRRDHLHLPARLSASTLIICMSIPISIVGTFALLYFAGFTLNTMTFGGLALGVGMIVDASIVVLENTFRHMEMGKSRMQAAIEGSEEVWSAILASTLTHIAVFVPLLFLSGVSSILFVQLSIVVMFSLSMSLFVAVTVVPVLCSRLLKLPPPVERAHGHHRAGCSPAASACSTGIDDTYRAIAPPGAAATGRRCIGAPRRSRSPRS